MLFCVSGTGRCGSGLVTEVLARHPDVGFVSNVDDKLSWLDLHGRSAAFRRDLDPANLALLERSLAGRLLAYDYPLTPTGGLPMSSSRRHIEPGRLAKLMSQMAAER